MLFPDVFLFTQVESWRSPNSIRFLWIYANINKLAFELEGLFIIICTRRNKQMFCICSVYNFRLFGSASFFFIRHNNNNNENNETKRREYSLMIIKFEFHCLLLRCTQRFIKNTNTKKNASFLSFQNLRAKEFINPNGLCICIFFFRPSSLIKCYSLEALRKSQVISSSFYFEVQVFRV